MQNVICPYCGKPADFVDTAEIYHGKSYGMAYLCRPCNAYVGVHKGTDKPKGSLANAELRNWRKAAHRAFDPLWKYGIFKHQRNNAYAWLSKKMGIPIEETHIAMFDIAKCRDAINLINKGDFHGQNMAL